MQASTTTKANWIKSITVGPSMEVRISDKGFVGVFNNGRWVCGMPATVFHALVNNNPMESRDFAEQAISIRESGSKEREEAKLKAKLTKEAEALFAKAAKLQEAGLDLAAILNKKQG